MYHTEKQNDSSFYLKKLTNHMKMCFFFLALFLFSQQARAMAQNERIDLKLQNATILEAVKAVEKQSNYKFVYNNADVDVSRKVSVNAVKEKIESVAKTIFVGYNISVKGNNVIVTPNKFANKFVGAAQQSSQRNVRGQVVDAKTEETIIGANIRVVGSDRGAVTDIDGRFSLPVSGTNTVLLITYIGYDDLQIQVGNRTNLGQVQLNPSSQALDEVVITAFGSGQKKASMVGSVQTIRPSELKVPSSNLSNSFAGRMAGVIAFQRSGQPGADGANFYIRGISTISGATQPLIILDGVQVNDYDLNALDPEVIEGFSILKDATATALYGTRGANGVMIVTTKSGANLGKPKINFRFEANMAQPSNIPKYADGSTYMRLYNEASQNLGSGVTLYTPEQIQGTAEGWNPYVYPNVNWYNELFKERAYNKKFHFNIRGGGKKLDYFMSASANQESGIIKGRSKEFFSFDNNINIKRYAFQNNINAHLGETSKISLRLNAQMTDRRTPNFDNINALFGYTVTANPVDFPIMYEPDGITEHIKWGGYKFGNTPVFNPVGALVSGYRDTFESTIIANLEFEQKLDFFTKGLKFNALASFKNWSATSVYREAPYNTYQLSSYERKPDGTFEYVVSATDTPGIVALKSTSGTEGERRLYLQAILDYNRTFKKVHAVNAMLVYNQDDFNLNNYYAKNELDIMINSLPKRKQGMAARLSYAYDNRYLFEANAGYNGSENFAKGHRWGFFPSIAIGYNVSEEAFFKPLTKIIQHLKIRSSWGLVGNDQIEKTRFIYLPQIDLYGQNFRTGIDMDYSLSGPKYLRYANYDLTWEVGEKLNLGFDVRIFNDVNINLDLFREHRRNIFQERGTIPDYLGTGETKVYGNTAEVMNKGIDLSLDYGKRFNKDLTVFLKGTFTYATNKILKYDEPSNQTYTNLVNVGRKLNSHLGYVAEGLFIDWAEIANRPTQMISGNIAPGDIKYKNFVDKNGNSDNQIDNRDRMFLGYPTVPEIVYGFGPNIRYKNWDFGLFFQGVANTSLMMSGFHPFGSNTRYNVAQWIVDSHWSPDRQDLFAEYPRLTNDTHENNRAPSTFWLRDASFLKLKNAEIGYTFRNMRFYVSGLNLLTFSKFKLWDPEQGGGRGLNYPTQRVLNAGFQMNIN